MSAPTLTSSPASGRSSADLPDPGPFEGAEALVHSWRQGLRPDPHFTVSEWADRYRVLAARASAEPGRYRTSRTPYMRAIMDALSPGNPAQRIVFMKAAQVGATETGNSWIGFVIHQAPGPMLAVQPTVELAKRNSRQRIDPLIEESAVLRDRVKPPRSRDAGNTMLSKEFAGGILIMTGANSAVGLRSTPARYLFLDEVDAYPASADEEGDPVTLAEARTLTFAHRRKVFLASTPTIHGLSRIEREYDASDKRRYFVPCPHCGAMQWLKFERLIWEKGRPETAAYHCEACDQPIAEQHKTAMLQQGEWRATAEAVDPTTVGFHLSALYSPVGWLSWTRIARNWEAAQGSDESLRAFRNTILGETWIERGEAPDWQRLYERRERWPHGTVPSGGLFLTAGADVQKDRIEVSVWAWGRGLSSWLIEHVVIEGGPDSAAAWSQLTELLGRTWPHAHGVRLGLSKLAIDTGYEAPAVYAFARKAGFAQVASIKGVEGFNRAAPVAGPTHVDATEGGRKIRRGARLWTVAVATFKAETYRFLRLTRPTDEEHAAGTLTPAGYIHLSESADAEWMKQLVAEQLVTVKTKRGFQKLEWQKLRERNEALDCRVYARAAAWIAGVDRWSEAMWRDLEQQIGEAPAFAAGSFVFAGDRKVDGNSHGALSERARADIQEDVNRLYADFCALVAANRGLTPEAVRATGAAIFRGDVAVRAGLADRIGTLDTAIADIATEFQQPPGSTRPSITSTPKRSPFMATEDTELIETAPLVPALAPAAPGPAAVPSLPVPPAPETHQRSDPAEALRTEYAEIAAISAQASRLGVTIDAADAMQKGIKPDALRRSVLDALASRSEATSVIAATPRPLGSGDSPIVRRARERAGQSQK